MQHRRFVGIHATAGGGGSLLMVARSGRRPLHASPLLMLLPVLLPVLLLLLVCIFGYSTRISVLVLRRLHSSTSTVRLGFQLPYTPAICAP